MKHTLKTLLVTTLLAAPTTYGANAANYDQLNSSMEPAQSTKTKVIARKHSFDPLDVTLEMLGWLDHSDLANVSLTNKRFNSAAKLALYDKINRHLLNQGISLNFPSKAPLQLKASIVISKDQNSLTTRSSEHKGPYSIIYYALDLLKQGLLKADQFQSELYSATFNTLIVFIKGLNLAQFKSLEELTRNELLTRAINGNEDAQMFLMNEWIRTNNSKAILKYAIAGWSKAQDYVAEGYARGKYGFARSTQELRKLARLGWSNAQDFVTDGYALGKYGFARNTQELRKLARMGCTWAQYYVSIGYAEGKFGFTRSKDKLLQLAHKMRWSWAQYYVSIGYAEGKFGFTKNQEELLELAHMGWSKTQELVSYGYAEGTNGFTQDKDKLLELAHMGWSKAQDLVAEGYATGKYGFTQDPEELLELAHMGWSKAQDYVAEGYARGIFGFTQNIEALLKFAIHGWPKAQELVAVGFERGWPGFTQDPTLSRILYLLFNLKKKQKI